MSCGSVMSGADADAVVARCRELGTDRVALSRDSLPGFDITTFSGVPDADYLKETVERIGEAGIEVYAVSKAYCMGKDMDVIRNPAAHRREIDEMLATVEAVAGAGIPVMLQYAHVDDPEDPAEDEDLWGGVAIIYREVVAQAETSGLKLANHGRWPTPDDAARARAAEQGIGLRGLPPLPRAGVGRPVHDSRRRPYRAACRARGAQPQPRRLHVRRDGHERHRRA